MISKFDYKDLELFFSEIENALEMKNYCLNRKNHILNSSLIRVNDSSKILSLKFHESAVSFSRFGYHIDNSYS